VQAHTPFAWEVALGTPTRASKVEFDGSSGNPATLEAPFGQLTVYVVDRRVVARHYVFPESPQGATQGQLRSTRRRRRLRTGLPHRRRSTASSSGRCSRARRRARRTPLPGDPPDAPRADRRPRRRAAGRGAREGECECQSRPGPPRHDIDGRARERRRDAGRPAVHAPRRADRLRPRCSRKPRADTLAPGRRRPLGRGPEPLRAGGRPGLRRQARARRRPDGGLRRRPAGRAAGDRPRQRDGFVPGRRRHGGRGRAGRDRQPARECPGREEGRGRGADERRRRPGRRAASADARPRPRCVDAADASSIEAWSISVWPTPA
jgi:hypothetical protein